MRNHVSVVLANSKQVNSTKRILEFTSAGPNTHQEISQSQESSQLGTTNRKAKTCEGNWCNFVSVKVVQTRMLGSIVSRLASPTQDGMKHPEMHKKVKVSRGVLPRTTGQTTNIAEWQVESLLASSKARLKNPSAPQKVNLRLTSKIVRFLAFVQKFPTKHRLELGAVSVNRWNLFLLWWDDSLKNSSHIVQFTAAADASHEMNDCIRYICPQLMRKIIKNKKKSKSFSTVIRRKATAP